TSSLSIKGGVSGPPKYGTVNRYVPAGTSIWSWPASAFASSTAARRLQAPPPVVVSHTPSPGVASWASTVVSTVKIADHAKRVVSTTATMTAPTRTPRRLVPDRL